MTPTSSHIRHHAPMVRNQIYVSRLPPELYRYIIQNITAQPDLVSLCITSRSIRDEAERILYYDIDLHRSNTTQLQSWSTTVASCPRRAALVRRLCLPSTEGPKLTFNGVENVFESMLRALEAVFNVKELTIRPHSLSTCLIQYCYYLAKGIRNYPFRLRKFHVEGDFLLFGSNPVAFLASQPDIRDWKSGGLVDVIRNPPASLLPRLDVVQYAYHSYYSDHDMLRHITSRPNMERIRIDLDMALGVEDVYSIVGTLRSCQQTLTHFHLSSCRSDAFMPWSPVELISFLADHTRVLKFVRYSVTMDYVGHLGCDQTRLLCILSRFQKLATLIVDPLQCPMRCHPVCFNWQLDSSARGLEVAKEIMSACPSLRRIAFKFPYRWTKRYHCYLKAGGGRVEFEGLDVVNDTSWKDM